MNRSSRAVCLYVTIVAGLCFAIVSAPVHAQAPPGGTVHRPAGASGTIVVPDQLLRSWDPITVFFTTAVGPATSGPEDRPERYVRLEPAHPVGARWLDARTLQLRPVDPWTPLERYTVSVDGRTVELATLMAPPRATEPADGTTGLETVESLRLTFDEPLDTAVLAQMIRLELRPLPGLDARSAQWVSGSDIAVKAHERSSQEAPATYTLTPSVPIGPGTRAIVHIRLAASDALAEATTTISFSTAEAFRIVGAGTWSTRLPLPHRGAEFPADQPVRGPADRRAIVLEFSSPPAQNALDPVTVRNLVRITPDVDELTAHPHGELVELTGTFRPETAYRITIMPQPIHDQLDRPLTTTGTSSLSVYFPRRSPFVRWAVAHGIVERFGPNRVPVQGRGHEQIDLRIHKIDPLDRSFWPFPDEPIVVDESSRPPGPGEAPPAFADSSRTISRWELERQLRTLGAPIISSILELPLREIGGAARFGLDLSNHLDQAVGRDRPGHYLVGLRRVQADTTRSWIRIQVTDLCLTVIEEPRQVRFVVTSLASGAPVSGARVQIHGSEQRRDGGVTSWRSFGDLVTTADGQAVWRPPGEDTRYARQVRRIVVEHDGDVLVLDPTQQMERFANGSWTESYGTWLQWTVERHQWRLPDPQELGHIFTERPVYRPGEPVHIAGWLRQRDAGRLDRLTVDRPRVVIRGPGDLEWHSTVQLTELGGFSHRFEGDTAATGQYTASITDHDGRTYARAAFQVEAYRLPRFEVSLHGPDRVALDRPFDIELTATYYAGGRVSQQPVRWRVTQFPYEWTPPAREGFRFSSDARFSGRQRFESTSRLERTDVTDVDGGARLELDPTLEPTAQPRSYVVEATVTGADEQTVTATRQVVALPPFVIGVRAPRVVEQAEQIVPEIVVLGVDGEPVADQELTVRLLHRQWHSHLQASDFSDGVARYITDQVETPVYETAVTSGEAAVKPTLPIDEAGVYVVEVTGRDRLGRAQTVQVDLYASGDEPVAWSRPATRTFDVSTDRSTYEPGTTATLVLASPFQRAEALIIVEGPARNQYQWTPVRGGAATVMIPIEPAFAPRVPVHTVLMRGRISGIEPQPGSTEDLGKPRTVATTTWLEVEPTSNRIDVTLEHPDSAQPGSVIDLTARLATPDGRPATGEVTVWLVDQAVLALGTEQRLDPLPDFLPPPSSHLELRDTRDLVFGQVPTTLAPGGGEGAPAREDLLDRVTVRKSFEPVPFYRANVPVGPDGVVELSVQLPDNLTNFKVRAKAASGLERFGFATGHLAVRLPVIVQPALPRFVRPGDRFTAAAVARVVSGVDGAGIAQWQVDGAEPMGTTRSELTLSRTSPARTTLEVELPGSSSGAVTFRAAVERNADGASDGFEAQLPIHDDRQPTARRELHRLAPGESVEVTGTAERYRPGSGRATVTVTGLDALDRIGSALEFLTGYPYGCTEQRVAQARAHLGVRRLREQLVLSGFEERLDRAVEETIAWIPEALTADGLVSFWPGGDGSVTLSAWVTQFLMEARSAGYQVDDELIDTLLDTLEQTLRSDDRRLVDGRAWADRTWALVALTGSGRPQAAYATELARRAEMLDLEGVALVLQAVAVTDGAQPLVEPLRQELVAGIRTALHQGTKRFEGLADRTAESEHLLESEIRTVAEMVNALSSAGSDAEHAELLAEALIRLSGRDRWYSTNAASATVLALAQRLEPPLDAAPRIDVSLSIDGVTTSTLATSASQPLATVVTEDIDPMRIEVSASSEAPATVRVDARWTPAEPGSLATPLSQGFVVTRSAVVPGSARSDRRWSLETGGSAIKLEVGEVIEERVEVVNPADRRFAAVSIPLAAGLEPLNPNLATASSDAKPSLPPSLPPTYVAFSDERVTFFFDTLPKGTLQVAFRCRASVPGRFIQPPATAELMYDQTVNGRSAGAWVEVLPAP